MKPSEKLCEDIKKIGTETHIPGIWEINNVLLEIIPNKINTNKIELLMIASNNKGNGDGSKVLNVLTKIADKYETEIDIVAVPLFEQTPNNTQSLIKWYAKFGFEYNNFEIPENWIECGVKMKRIPFSEKKHTIEQIEKDFPVDNTFNYSIN